MTGCPWWTRSGQPAAGRSRHWLLAATLCCALAACTSTAGHQRAGGACGDSCRLELTNATPFELDVRVSEAGGQAGVHDLLAAGETRVVALGSGVRPIVTVIGLRMREAPRGTVIRVHCTTPVRGGDVFRSECRASGAARAPGAVPARDTAPAVQ